MIPMWKFAPAIACGNAFILKPSERDPGVPMMLAQLMIAAERWRMSQTHRRTHPLQAQVLGQQLLERQALLRRMMAEHELAQVRIRRWPVHIQQRVAQRGQAVFGA